VLRKLLVRGRKESLTIGLLPYSKICMSAVVGSQYLATTVAAESLIAQLDLQGNLSTPRRENLKIRHENEILKANEHASYV
jgi:hypothetical protein